MNRLVKMFTHIFQVALLSMSRGNPSRFLVEVDLGQLEQVFTGLFQAGFIIGVLLLLIGIFVIFFPGLKVFVGQLLNL
jgi:hypothetical protein